MQLIDYYKQLLTNPSPLESFGQYSVFTLSILALGLVFALLLAVALHHMLAANREQFGEWVGVRMSWAWAAVALGVLVLLDISVLWFQSRVVSWSAVSPHVTVASLAGFTGLIIYFGANNELKSSQRALSRAQRSGQ